MMKYAVEFDKVTVAYEDRIALLDVSFKIPCNKFTCILGPNGAGKTTLLKTVLGLIEPVTGSVKVFGKEVATHKSEIRKLIGYVPQKDVMDLSIPVTVKDVVSMGLYGRHSLMLISRRKIMEKVSKALKIVGLSNLLETPFSHLSGGQQQRVLIARALVKSPRMLILDEPFSGIDIASRDVIIKVLKEFVDKRGTVIMSTHDINPVLDYADYIMLLNKSVIAFGPKEEVMNEESFSKLYGLKTRFISLNGRKYVFIGDESA